MVTTLLEGLSNGALYALVAAGLSFIFTTTGVFNFAQPQLLMLGTFIAYWVTATLGLPFGLAIPIAAGVIAAVALVESKVALEPLIGRSMHGELVTTVGFAAVISGFATLIWGDNPLRLPVGGSSTSWRLFGGVITPVNLFIILVAFAIIGAVQCWSRLTMSGLASLATAENREAAMLRGVNVRRQATLAMLIVGCITGAVAPLVASSTYAVYSLGTSLTFYAFVALTVGGFDSRGGVLVGGLIVGLVQAEAGRYLNAEYQDIAIFILLLSALLVRPQGLFGHARERKV